MQPSAWSLKVFSADLFLPLLPVGSVDNVLYRAQVGLRDESITIEKLRDMFSCFPSGQGVVFPSHFFEFERKAECITCLEEFAIPFWIQISPGAELKDYSQELLALSRREGSRLAGVELVMDRAPHVGDWNLLRGLESAGLRVRYVYCPVVEIRPIEVMKQLPASVFPALYFYFPEKDQTNASFLSADEIFLFLEQVKESFPGFSCRIMEHLSQFEVVQRGDIKSEVRCRYRRNPRAEFYAEHFSLLGDHGLTRKILSKAARTKLLAPLIFVSHLFLAAWLERRAYWSAIRVYWSSRALLRRLFWDSAHLTRRVYHFFRHLFFYSRTLVHRSWHLVHFVRHVPRRVFAFVVSLYWKSRALGRWIFWNSLHGLRRVIWAARHAGRSIAWKLNHVLFAAYRFVRHPIWSLRVYAPVLYWIFVFPVQKAYWFLAFQFKKRVLKYVAGRN